MKNFLEKINDKYFFSTKYDQINDFSIFNNQTFINLHKDLFERVFQYFLIEEKTLICKGVATFAIDNEDHIKSPINGSYGGFEFKKDIYFDIKEKFICRVIKELKKNRPKSIEIILPPDIYDIENNSEQISILHRNNFLIKNIEVNQYIKVQNYNLKKSVNKGNRQKIKKCISIPLLFHELKFEEYKLAYQLILENRKAKNFKLSMNWEQLSSMLSKFPKKFLVFGIFKDKEMIASAICIKIQSNILYVFYWGERLKYKSLSPVAFLSHEIINYCISNKISILDLGTSSYNSLPNYGLINFKKGIGSFSCNKLKLINKLIKK